MRRIIGIFICLFAYLFTYSLNVVSAHVSGQPPFFTINGKLSGYYQVPLTTDKLQLPLDSSPETYVINQTLNFHIEQSLLPLNPEQLPQTVFEWDFGDGTKGTGISNTHTYRKQGSYILSVFLKEPGQDRRLIQATLLHVLPNKNYHLPKAVIQVNGTVITDPLVDVVYSDYNNPAQLSAQKSEGGSASIEKYEWVLNNTQTSLTPTATYQADKNMQLSFIILRVTTADGFFQDAWVQLTNTNEQAGQTNTPQKNPVASLIDRIGKTSTSLVRNAFNIEQNPLLMFVSFLLVFIAGGLHAITPGHGKSLMGVYLLGKKKGSVRDVFFITLSITVTHTAVIFLLGFIFLGLEHTTTLSQIIPYFERLSALVVLLLAVNLIRNGYEQYLHTKAHEHGEHHEHHHHDEVKITSRKDLLMVGVSGGIMPCIDAFALLALSVSVGKILLGIFFVFIFSLGLASTIALLGFVLIHGKDKLKLEERFGKVAEIYGPIVSGIIIFLIALRLLL